jgi:hypothetical protein
MIERVLEPLIAGITTHDDAGFAAPAGHRGHPGQAAQGVIIYNFAGYLSSNTTRSDIYHNIYKSWKDVITAAVESVPEQDNNYVDILSAFHVFNSL